MYTLYRAEDIYNKHLIYTDEDTDFINLGWVFVHSAFSLSYKKIKDHFTDCLYYFLLSLYVSLYSKHLTYENIISNRDSLFYIYFYKPHEIRTKHTHLVAFEKIQMQEKMKNEILEELSIYLTHDGKDDLIGSSFSLYEIDNTQRQDLISFVMSFKKEVNCGKR